MKVWVTSLGEDPKPCDAEGERNAECVVENDCSKYCPKPCDYCRNENFNWDGCFHSILLIMHLYGYFSIISIPYHMLHYQLREYQWLSEVILKH